MTNVSRETSEKLDAYAALLRKWSPRINLVAPSTLNDLESRHIADSRQLSMLTTPVQNWADLGSGGGLPGAIIAILRPETPVTLVESDARKATFLRTLRRELALPNLIVLNDRIEQANPLNAALVSARALAPLGLLMAYVDRHLAPGGTALLMKGKDWESEVRQARESWQFDLIPHPSQTAPDAAILEITNVARK